MTGAYFAGINSENYSIPNISYDKNGNITNLQRKGKSNGTYTDIDNLSYNYNGNQLVGVTDGINGNEDVGDFQDNGSNSEYNYWSDGSLKSDANKGITLIEYDTFLKKVKQINIGSNWIKFFYDGSGILIRRSNSLGDVWDYCPNGMIYKNGQPYQLPIPEGRAVYVAGQWIYEFEYFDHLGNLRVSFRANGNQLTITQSNTPDPFGLDIKPLSIIGNTPNNFQFNKIEKVNDFGINIHHAFFRDGDSQIGRWWQIDSKPNPSMSLYAMMGNNPMRYSDPMGDTTIVNNRGTILKQYGKDNSV
jgi:RHS repeat-associated protein